MSCQLPSPPAVRQVSERWGQGATSDLGRPGLVTDRLWGKEKGRLRGRS